MPRGQQDRALQPAEEEQRRQVGAIQPDPDVHAGVSTVTFLDLADHVTPAHPVALVQLGLHRFVTREHPAAVVDRQHGAVDDDAGEVHDPVGGGEQLDKVTSGDVDPAVARSVVRGWREEWPQYRPWLLDGPVPERDRPRGEGHGIRNDEHHGESGETARDNRPDAEREWTNHAHAAMVVQPLEARRTEWKNCVQPRDRAASGGLVCFSQHVAVSGMTTRALCVGSRRALHPLSLTRKSAADQCWAPGFAPSGARNN